MMFFYLNWAMFRPQIDISIVVTSRSYNVKRNKIVSYCQIDVILPYPLFITKSYN